MKAFWEGLKKLFGRRGPGADVRPEILIFGLGNPGGKYEGTRHNIGFEVIDRLRAVNTPVSPPEMRGEAEYGLVKCGAALRPVMLVKPLTYMNRSGDAALPLIRGYKMGAADCLVVVDDFSIPLGKIRFRKSGSPGGHNGLKSITAAIGQEFPRLRVGIGPLPEGANVLDFVLGRFEDGEREEVDKVVETAAEAVVFMIENGLDAAMNRYNK